jgi:hypothetical protein
MHKEFEFSINNQLPFSPLLAVLGFLPLAIKQFQDCKSPATESKANTDTLANSWYSFLIGIPVGTLSGNLYYALTNQISPQISFAIIGVSVMAAASIGLRCYMDAKVAANRNNSNSMSIA